MKIKGDGWASDYDSVDRLLKYLREQKSASEPSRNRHCGVLSNFCAMAGQIPDELVKCEKSVIEEMIEKFAGRYDCPKTANTVIALLKTFFRTNGFKKNRELDVKGRYQPPRYRKQREYVPTLEEVIKMAECAGSLRNRAIIYVFLSTGLRSSTPIALQFGICTDPRLYNYTIKNELARGMKNIMIVVHEGLKKNVPGACKNRIPYYGFTFPNATEAVKDYLAERRRKYGDLSDDDPLFNSEYNQVPSSERQSKFMSSREVQDVVKTAARKAGIKDWKYVTPKSLRKTFESAMRNQPSAVRLDTKDQEFFMGHILPGSQDNYYDREKVEEMRMKYAKMRFEPSQTHTDMQLIEEMAELFGIDMTSIKSEAEEKLGREPSSSEVRRFLKEKIRQKINGGRREKEQRVIVEEDIERYLNDGWGVQSVLHSGRIIVCKEKRNGGLDNVSPSPSILQVVA